MKSCEEARAALAERTFGELDETTETRLNEHLLECDACRMEEARLRELHDLVRGSEVAPGPELRRRVRAALPRPVPAPLGLLLRPVPAYAAIAAGLLGALLVAILPVLRHAKAQIAPAGTRAVGVPLDQGPPAFTVAGSFETRVAPTGRVSPERDSARTGVRSRSDSL